MQHRKIAALLVTISVVTVVAVALFVKGPDLVEKLIMADATQPVFALVYIADAKGYFSEEGVEISYLSFTSGRDALASVVGGDADVATVFETPIVLSTSKSEPVRVLSTLHTSNRNTAIVARRDLGIDNPVDLRGKRIGVTFNTNGEFFLSQFLINEGIGLETVELVDLPPNGMAEALANGDVAAIASWAPHTFSAQRTITSGDANVFHSTAYTEISVLAVLTETIARKEEALIRMLRALIRAEKFIASNEEDSIAIVAKRLSGQSEQDVRAAWANFRAELRLNNVLLSVLSQEGAWLSERGIIPKPAPEFRQVLYPDFLNGIQPESVTVRLD